MRLRQIEKANQVHFPACDHKDSPDCSRCMTRPRSSLFDDRAGIPSLPITCLGWKSAMSSTPRETNYLPQSISFHLSKTKSPNPDHPIDDQSLSTSSLACCQPKWSAERSVLEKIHIVVGAAHYVSIPCFLIEVRVSLPFFFFGASILILGVIFFSSQTHLRSLRGLSS